MPDEGSLTNLAQVFTAAREARTEHPDESRFAVAMRGIAAAQELADPLYPLQRKLTEQRISEASVNLSNLIREKDDALADAQAFANAAAQFRSLPAEDKLNYPTPGFRTAKAQQQWTNFLNLNLATDQAQQVAQQRAADRQYHITALGLLDPADRAEVMAIRDPAIQARALDLAVKAKRQQQLSIEEEARLREIGGRIRVAEIQAGSREKVAEINAQRMADIAEMHLRRTDEKGQVVSKQKFIDRHLNTVMNHFATTDKAVVGQWLADFYDEYVSGLPSPAPPPPTTPPTADIPTVTNEEQWKALPSSTIYQDSTGKRYRKQ